MKGRQHPVWHPPVDCDIVVLWQPSVPQTFPDSYGRSDNAVVVGFRAHLCEVGGPHPILLQVSLSLVAVTGSAVQVTNFNSKGSAYGAQQEFLYALC